MAELNLAGNEMGKESGDYYAKADMSGIIALAGVIPGMGAISKFTFRGDDDNKSVTMQNTMTVADLSGKGLGISGAIMLSAFLPKCT
jgi:hypothetical protein